MNCGSCHQSSCFGQCLQTGAPIPPSVVPLSERYPSGSQVNLKALFDAHLDATKDDVLQIEFLVEFMAWILHEDFRRLHQLEPVVGRPLSTYPAAVEDQGIRGQSVYTCLFNHLDMETFTCKICDHIVKENLEDAITHQRIAHFDHRPYQCPNTNWYVPFPFPWVRIKNAFSIQRAAIRKSNEAGRASAPYWTLSEGASSVL